MSEDWTSARAGRGSSPRCRGAGGDQRALHVGRKGADLAGEASVEAATSVLCAARAPDRTESAVAVPAAVSVRSISAASDLIWLATSEEVATSGRLGVAGADSTEAAVAEPAAVRGALDIGRQ